MAPKVVASPDGLHLAILLDGRLSLYSLDGGKHLAEEEVVAQDLRFCGPHLFLHAHDGAGSLLTLLSVPQLKPVSVLELPTPTRLQAASGAYALLDQGDQALMAQAINAAIAVAPLRPPATFARAVGLEASQFVTFGTRGAEVWDATTRRPLARLGLQLPDDTRDLGLTNRGASLWIAGTQPALHLARISDGRLSTLRLDAPPRHVRSHPHLAWAVADVGDRTLAINLAIKEVEDVTVASGDIIAIVPVRERETGALLVVLDQGRLQLRPVGADGDEVTATGAEPPVSSTPPPMPVRDEPPPPTAVEAPAPPGASTIEAPRALTVRERLAQRMAQAGAVAVPPPAAARAVTSTPVAPAATATATALVESLDPLRQLPPDPNDPAVAATPAPEPLPATSTPAPPPNIRVTIGGVAVDPRSVPMLDPSPRPTVIDPPTLLMAPPSSPTAPGARGPRTLAPIPRSTEPERWREELLTWARTTLDERPSAPTLERTPLHALRERLHLTPAASTILYSLYAAWLDGRGEQGISISRLAELAAFAGEDAWAEARGVGHLDALGLVQWSFGRARLSPGTAEFLDGRAPTTVELLGHGAPTPLPEGVFRVDAERGESARACVQRLTHVLGRQLVYSFSVIALCEPEGTTARAVRPQLEQGRLEAWLRGLPLASTFDLSIAAPRPGETLLWIVPGGMPDRPGGPPRWRP